MSTISANAVKDLREITGAGMMDCKRALTECNGDMEAAKDWLRKKGQAIANKKAARKASEGLVFCKIDAAKGVAAMLELNCETDFVARNEAFPKLGRQLLDQVMAGGAGTANGSSEELLAAPDASNPAQTVQDLLKANIATLGENLGVGAFVRMDASANAANTFFESYIHPLGGKVGVLIQIGLGNAATKEKAEFLELCHDLALHIASSSPVSISRDGVSAETIERERAIYREQAANEGKAEAMLDKIAEGRINKFYKTSCLLEQEFVKNPEETVQKLVERIAKQLGDKIEIVKFTRIKIGA